MKIPRLFLMVTVLCIGTVVAQAQQVIEFGPEGGVQVSPSPLPTPTPETAPVIQNPSQGIDDGVVSYKRQVIGQCRAHLENDESLQPRQKNFKLKLLELPIVQSRILRMVTPKALESGALSVVVDEDFNPDNVIRIDLDKLLELFEKLMPFILMLLDLFGEDTTVAFLGSLSCDVA